LRGLVLELGDDAQLVWTARCAVHDHGDVVLTSRKKELDLVDVAVVSLPGIARLPPHADIHAGEAGKRPHLRPWRIPAPEADGVGLLEDVRRRKRRARVGHHRGLAPGKSPPEGGLRIPGLIGDRAESGGFIGPGTWP